MIVVVGVALAGVGVALQLGLYLLESRGKRLSVEVVAYWRPSDEALVLEMKRRQGSPWMEQQGAGILAWLGVSIVFVHLTGR